jgi:hypothetical protein
MAAWPFPVQADDSRAVRLDSVVVAAPGFDQHLGLSEAVEDLAVEQLIAQRSVEAFVIAVLPRRSRCDVKRLHPDPSEPLLNSGGDKLAAVV